MPIIKSAIKRARQAETRRERNVRTKTAVAKDTKAVVNAAIEGDTKAASTNLQAAYSEIDRAVKKGYFHKNTAARRKSKLAKLVATIESKKSGAASTAKPKKSTTKPAQSKVKGKATKKTK